MVVHTFNLSTREGEAGQAGLQSKFQNKQGYTKKPCLEKQQQTGQGEAHEASTLSKEWQATEESWQ